MAVGVDEQVCEEGAAAIGGLGDAGRKNLSEMLLGLYFSLFLGRVGTIEVILSEQ